LLPDPEKRAAAQAQPHLSLPDPTHVGFYLRARAPPPRGELEQNLAQLRERERERLIIKHENRKVISSQLNVPGAIQGNATMLKLMPAAVQIGRG
jgi:hypothetical protein